MATVQGRGSRGNTAGLRQGRRRGGIQIGRSRGIRGGRGGRGISQDRGNSIQISRGRGRGRGRGSPRGRASVTFLRRGRGGISQRGAINQPRVTYQVRTVILLCITMRKTFYFCIHSVIYCCRQYYKCIPLCLYQYLFNTVCVCLNLVTVNCGP